MLTSSSFGQQSVAAPNGGFGMMQHQHQQQQQPQLAGQMMGAASGPGMQPVMQPGMLGRPASTGVMMGQVSGQGAMGGFGMSAGGDVDTSNMTLPQLQQLLRQRQAQQQQQQQQMGFGAGAMGGYGGMGGVGGVLRPTSLQDHLTGGLGAGGMAPDPSQWRPALGVVPSATGMQGFATPGETALLGG